MNNRVMNLINRYCEETISDFCLSSYYNRILEKTKELSYRLDVFFMKIDSKKKNVQHYYLDVSVYNSDGKYIEVWDDGVLFAETCIVSIDKRDRCKFFDWCDEDFIDSLNWIIDNLDVLFKDRQKTTN